MLSTSDSLEDAMRSSGVSRASHCKQKHSTLLTEIIEQKSSEDCKKVSVVQCPDCCAVYHRSCAPQVTQCPRCERRRLRALRPLSPEVDVGEDALCELPCHEVTMDQNSLSKAARSESPSGEEIYEHDTSDNSPAILGSASQHCIHQLCVLLQYLSHFALLIALKKQFTMFFLSYLFRRHSFFI